MKHTTTINDRIRCARMNEFYVPLEHPIDLFDFPIYSKRNELQPTNRLSE